MSVLGWIKFCVLVMLFCNTLFVLLLCALDALYDLIDFVASVTIVGRGSGG